MSVSNGQLKAIVDRIERLDAERQAISSDIKEIYAEAKGNGFDVKIIRKIISRRKIAEAKRQEEDALLELYMADLGMTPIESAIAGAP